MLEKRGRVAVDSWGEPELLLNLDDRNFNLCKGKKQTILQVSKDIFVLYFPSCVLLYVTYRLNYQVVSICTREVMRDVICLEQAFTITALL